MSKQSQVPVWVISVSQPPAQKEKAAIDPVTVNVACVRYGIAEFLLRCGRQHLVSIENKDPVVLELKIFQRPVFLFRPCAIEAKLFDSCTMLLGNSRRIIGTLRIDNNYFVSPSNGIEATR